MDPLARCPFWACWLPDNFYFATLSVSMSTKLFFRRSTPALEVLSSSALLVSLLALTTGLPGPCPSFRWAMQSSRPLLVSFLALFCDNVSSPPALSQHPQGCLPPSSLGLGLISVRTRTAIFLNRATRPTVALPTILVGQSWLGGPCSNSARSSHGCARCPFGACWLSPLLGRHFVYLTIDTAFLPPIDYRIQGLIFFSLGFPLVWATGLPGVASSCPFIQPPSEADCSLVHYFSGPAMAPRHCLVTAHPTQHPRGSP